MYNKQNVLLSFLAKRFSMRGAKIVIILALMTVGWKNADIKNALGTS